MYQVQVQSSSGVYFKDTSLNFRELTTTNDWDDVMALELSDSENLIIQALISEM